MRNTLHDLADELPLLLEVSPSMPKRLGHRGDRPVSSIEKITFWPRPSRQATRRSEREEGVRTPQTALVARLLVLTHDIEARIEAGTFHDYADVSRGQGLPRARPTQVMNLLLLALRLQEDAFHLDVLTTTGRSAAQ